ncbi:UDP-glucose 4-epimerase GalE [Pantoea ananatis]|uniref:UDP-glucose 4-epimerase GalE n=1 Tax=Pantoea ananas TaxID=553 RepID=UPI001B302B37|nr:UDP-glucose 4-epimerase GalE [Pantoea ananatis]
MKVLVTGGTGYIGSHIVVELIQNGHDVVILDNLVNSDAGVIDRIETLTGLRPIFTKGDIRDASCLKALFAENGIDLVIHTAGLKAVGESTRLPLEYYHANVAGTVTLCQAMREAGIFRLAFSSSATVYGAEAPIPYKETMPRGTTVNPYGTSKAMIEGVLEDLCHSDPRWSVAFLRFFNPIGAHSSGMLGELPSGIPNNLMPFITQVAAGHLKELSVYGDDYQTEDGTCKRDYLHVMDIARGHLSVLSVMDKPGVHIFNLGTGKGTSVLELLECFQTENGLEIPYAIRPRREGDLPAFWADVEKARTQLGWEAQMSLEDMVRHSWQWQKNYAEETSGAE